MSSLVINISQFYYLFVIVFMTTVLALDTKSYTVSRLGKSKNLPSSLHTISCCIDVVNDDVVHASRYACGVEAADMQQDSEAVDRLPDPPSASIQRLRKIPCFGIAMAFASGICFATASFTVELMQGDSGHGVDASLVVTGRYVQSLRVHT